MISQQEKAELFKSLHDRPGCFILPNPWDAGSAKILASMGFEALATTSAGLASTLGRCDGRGLITRDEAYANKKAIVEATDLPVSADLENGFHDEPAGVFDAISWAADLGLVGASIEDATGNADKPLYDLDHAVDRMRAAVEAAQGLDWPFILTARAENYLLGRPDLADTIRRLQAFQEAGADVLYAPGLKSADDIASLVREVDRPVNVVMGLSGVNVSVLDLTALGVKRITLGSSLNRAAFGALVAAAQEVLDHGTFTFAERAITFDQLDLAFDEQHLTVRE